MANKLLDSIAAEGSYKAAGNYICGVRSGFWFAADMDPGKGILSVEVPVAALEQDRMQEVRAAFDSIKKESMLTSCAYNGKAMVVTTHRKFVSKHKEFSENFERLLGNIISWCNLAGAKTACTSCGVEGLHTQVTVGGKPQQLCSSCLSAANQRMEAGETKEGNYVTGFIGALVGAAIGMIVWVAVARLGYIVGIIGALIAFLSAHGYKLLRGRTGRGMPFIVGLCVLAAVFMGNIIDWVIELVASYDFWVSEAFIIMLASVWDFAYMWDFWANVGIGIIFAFFGAFAILKRLSGEAKGDHVKVERI